MQGEIRSARADSLRTFGARSSNVTIVGNNISIAGSVTGGDVIRGSDRERLLLYQFRKEEVAKISRVYVPPSNFQDLLVLTRRARVMLLRIDRRWGGTTTAVRLLAGCEAVHEIRFDGMLSDLPVTQLPTSCGFVMKHVTTSQLSELKARHVATLHDHLVARNGKLIVIIEANAQIPDDAVQCASVTVTEPPNAADLVANHLAELLGSTETAERVLSDPGLTEVLGAVEPDSFDARQLVGFARDLAELPSGRGTVGDALDRFKDRSWQDVGLWFDGITDIDERATVVSLAVLDGMTYDAVSRAIKLLVHEWHSDGIGPSQPTARTRTPRAARLTAARAKISTDVHRTRYGSTEMEVVSFLDSTYPVRVLHRLWHEHDYDRDVALHWLSMLAEDVEGRVRIRAATALGYLSLYSFDAIRRDIVVPWAGSGNGDERERAVAALAVPARHPETAPLAVRLVLEWCDRKKQALRLTAARALGSSVGAVMPGGPDERLGALAEKAETNVAIAIGDSIAELFTDAPPRREIELLTLLDAWSREGKGGRQQAGVLGFLEVAAVLWTTITGPEGNEVWPTLLRLAWLGTADAAKTNIPSANSDTEYVELRKLVTDLWGRALLAPGGDLAVGKVLGSWASAAERIPHVQSAMVSLFLEAAATRRHVDILAFHARSWRDRRALAPDLAARLLAVLERKG
jgi:hypothetical protein